MRDKETLFRIITENAIYEKADENNGQMFFTACELDITIEELKMLCKEFDISESILFPNEK